MIKHNRSFPPTVENCPPINIKVKIEVRKSQSCNKRTYGLSRCVLWCAAPGAGAAQRLASSRIRGYNGGWPAAQERIHPHVSPGGPDWDRYGGLPEGFLPKRLPLCRSVNADCVMSRQPREARKRRRKRRRRRKWWPSSTVCRAPRKSRGYANVRRLCDVTPAGGGSLRSRSTLRSECEMCPSPQKPKCFRPQNRASNLTVWETQRWRRSACWGEARWASPTQITSRWCWICPRSRASRSPTSTSVRKRPPSRCLWRESVRAQCEVNLSLRNNMDARNSHRPRCVVTKSPDSPAWFWFRLLRLSRLCTNVAFNVKIKVRILTGELKQRATLVYFYGVRVNPNPNPMMKTEYLQMYKNNQFYLFYIKWIGSILNPTLKSATLLSFKSFNRGKV